MKISSFKEVLLRKSTSEEVANLVKDLADDRLLDLVTESLEKMAINRGHSGAPNGAVLELGSSIKHEHDASDGQFSPTKEMLYDNLSHHISHYKAAKDSGNQDVANAHAKKIFDNMHLAHKLDRATNGLMGVDAADVKAWERNSKLNRVTEDSKQYKGRGGKKDLGEYSTDTIGWGLNTNDYSFLSNPPHHSHVQEIKDHQAKHDSEETGIKFGGGYPLEHIKMGGKHVDVHPVENKESYEPHFFDEHPIWSHYKEPKKNRTFERDAQFNKEHESFLDKHGENFINAAIEMSEKNPNRGSKPSMSVHGEHHSPLDLNMEPTETKSGLPYMKRKSASSDKEPVAKPASSLSDILSQNLSDEDKKQKLTEMFRASGHSDEEIDKLVPAMMRMKL